MIYNNMQEMKSKLYFKGLVIALISIIGLSTSCVSADAENQEKKAKYIFLFIGDGMGTSHVAATESYLSYKAGKVGGEMLTMSTFPVYGYSTTYSADSHITCSAAGGTAIACGQKTKNNMLGMSKDSVAIRSIAHELKEDGYKVGIVSSVAVNHATPAAFYGHHINRDSFYEIGRQIASSGFEFFGCEGFIDLNGENGNLPALDNFIEKNGYKVFYGLDEYNRNKKTKNVVLCQPSKKEKSAENYAIESKSSEDMKLEQMLETAIGHLGDEKPFFIMCEGGKIDWTAHANLTMAMVKEILEFDKAIDRALEFYRQHPDETLIVVTSDHETGGIALGCTSKEYKGSTIKWDILEAQWEESGHKLKVDKSRIQEYKAAIKKLNDQCGIGWTSSKHTGAPVPVFSIGYGSERFVGRMDNNQIKSKILGE